MKTDKKKAKNLQLILILAGMILGGAVGFLWENAAVLEPLGKLYINLLMCTVVPLIFFSITSTIGNMSNTGKGGKTVLTALGSFLSSSLIAGAFAMVIFMAFPLSGIQIAAEPAEAEAVSLTVFSMMESLFSQSDFLSLFNAKAILPMVTAAVLFGMAIRKCGGAESPAARLFTNLYECTIKVIHFIGYYMPIGLFGVFATLSARYGSLFVGEYLKVVVMTGIIEVLYFVLAVPLYTLFAAGKNGVKVVLRHIGKIIPVALGTCSSVATVPVNIEQANDSGIPQNISGLVIPLGSNMNMNGSVMLHIARIYFLFAFFGRTMTPVETLLILLGVAIISLITPGIPGSSEVTPSILFPILFPGDFGLAMALASPLGRILDPILTMVNATMDYIMTFVVTRFVEGKNWLKKKENSEQV